MKALILISLLISAPLLAAESTPTKRVYQTIEFADDLNFENIDLVVNRQIRSFDRIGLKGNIKFGTKLYPKSVLKESLLVFQRLTEETKECFKTQSERSCLNEFNAQMNKRFAIYAPVPAKGERGYGSSKTTQFTSYYSPDFHGSRTKTERFKRAIYKMPDNPADQNYTRVEIDYKGALDGKGHEIFYVEESYFDLYLLHVQGGGRIHVMNPDGSEEISYLSYGGKNTRSFQMIYKYMQAKGYLSGANVGIPGQRKFLEENPHLEEEIFGSCPSYVYFNESKEEPVGVNNIPLTEGRSVAIDSRIYKTMGLLNFVKTVKASHLEDGVVKKVPFGRFFVAQDTGGAIRGNARCDLYFGYGPQAELTAYNMNEQGEQYFLVLK